jgi:hypothetical protein
VRLSPGAFQSSTLAWVASAEGFPLALVALGES